MNYNLTDFSLEELRLLKAELQSSSQDMEKFYYEHKHIAPKTAAEIKAKGVMLREIQVRVMTAYNIVKQRQLNLSN